jgi:hypothetical protein
MPSASTSAWRRCARRDVVAGALELNILQTADRCTSVPAGTLPTEPGQRLVTRLHVKVQFTDAGRAARLAVVLEERRSRTAPRRRRRRPGARDEQQQVAVAASRSGSPGIRHVDVAEPSASDLTPSGRHTIPTTLPKPSMPHDDRRPTRSCTMLAPGSGSLCSSTTRTASCCGGGTSMPPSGCQNWHSGRSSAVRTSRFHCGSGGTSIAPSTSVSSTSTPGLGVVAKDAAAPVPPRPRCQQPAGAAARPTGDTSARAGRRRRSGR